MSVVAARTRIVVINEQPYLCDRRRSFRENIDDVREAYDVPVATVRLAAHSDFGFICDRIQVDLNDLPIALEV